MCGYVSIAPQRLMRLKINKNERNKLLKEMAMADVLANHGFRVHLVEEDPRRGSFDALINGVPADFNRTKSHNNIKKYAKRAIKQQQARIIVFQLDNENPAIHKELMDLSHRGITVIYYFTNNSELVYTFP